MNLSGVAQVGFEALVVTRYLLQQCSFNPAMHVRHMCDVMSYGLEYIFREE